MCATARKTQTGVEYLIRPPVNRRVVNHKRTEMEQGRKGLGEHVPPRPQFRGEVVDVREADSHLANRLLASKAVFNTVGTIDHVGRSPDLLFKASLE